MSLIEYAVGEDFFQCSDNADFIVDFDFPCCCCRNNSKEETGFPCKFCGHNLNSVEHYQCRICGEFVEGDYRDNDAYISPKKIKFGPLCPECIKNIRDTA